MVRVSVPRCRHDVRTRTSHFIQRIIWKDSEGKTRITKLSCYRLKHPNVWQSQFYRKTSAQKYLQRSWRLYMCLMCHSGSAPATQRRLVSPTTTSLGSSPSTNAVHRSLLVIQLSFLSVYNMPAPRPQFSGCCPPSLIISYSNSCRYSNSRRHGTDFYSNPNPSPQGSPRKNTAQVRRPQSDSRSTVATIRSTADVANKGRSADAPRSRASTRPCFAHPQARASCYKWVRRPQDIPPHLSPNYEPAQPVL